MSHIDDAKLHAYLDGECAQRERAQIEAHLALCDECQARLEQAAAANRTASELLAQLEPGPVHAPSWREIEERAVARKRSASDRSWLRPSLAWAAMLVIAFGLGWFSNTYWSKSIEPLATTPRVESPLTVVGELEADQLRQSPAEAQPAAETSERSAEMAPRGAEEQKQYPESRAKSTDERLASKPQPGRDQPAEDVLREEADRERLFADAQKREQAAENLADEVAADAAAVPPATEPPPVVAGVEANRAAGERRGRPDVSLTEQAQPEAEPLEGFAVQSVLRLDVGETAGFFRVQPEDAAVWLDAELRTLPDLQLKRVEVGPGGAVPGGLPGLPAVQLVYEDAAGHEFTLIQQRIDDVTFEFEEAQPVLTVDPDGPLAYRWFDGRGYRLILVGEVSSDSLRALAERVR